MIDYQKVLADLESRRAMVVADLDASIRTVRQIIQAAGGQVQQFRPAQVGEQNQTKMVFDFLVKEQRSKSAKDAAAGTGLSEKAVHSILNRLYKSKKIDRPSRGKFRAKAQTQVHEMSAA